MADCEACSFASEHGHWGKTLPKGFTHCSDCHTSWPGTQVWGHCAACHVTFRGVITFDRHHDAKLCSPEHPLRAKHWRYGGVNYIRRKHETGFYYYQRDTSEDEDVDG